MPQARGWPDFQGLGCKIVVGLASQDITKVLCASALHHLHFCVNPASAECRSLCTSGAMGTFLLWGWCPTHQACWPLVFWHNALLPTCPVPSNHVRTVQTHPGWWQSPALSRNCHHILTQHILICGLMGCQQAWLLVEISTFPIIKLIVVKSSRWKC